MPDSGHEVDCCCEKCKPDEPMFSPEYTTYETVRQRWWKIEQSYMHMNNGLRLLEALRLDAYADLQAAAVALSPEDRALASARQNLGIDPKP